MYFAKINDGKNKFGLTNQIFSLISSIILAHSKKIPSVVVDYFSNDYDYSGGYSPISEILNLEKTNEFLKETYHITLIDRSKIDYTLIEIKLGNSKGGILNVTSSFEISGESIIVKKNDNLVNFHQKYQYLYLKLGINGFELDTKCLYLFLYHHGQIKFEKLFRYHLNMMWIHQLDREMFDNILCHLRFHADFESCDIVVQPQEKSVIHLRVEEDACQHWSNLNQISYEAFRDKIVSKYIQIIKNHVPIHERLMIVSASVTNPVIDFLEKNGYRYEFLKKRFPHREKNAIVDLLGADGCNSVFIGNFNLERLCGSTFSYFVLKRLRPGVKKILIDLDNIFQEETIMDS